ncbi:protein kinase domain-containing protein [Streptomyces sp. NPDC002206]
MTFSAGTPLRRSNHSPAHLQGGGTLPYMAPECWKYQRATGATDIYALGVLAYELLEGTRPFTGPYEHDYQEQHLHGTPPPLTTAPALLAALITECLFRAPQGRPAAGNVLERLRRIPTASLAGGLAALAEANRAEAARRSEADRQASAEATEAERRQDLLEVAGTSLRLISDHLLTTITNIVSTAEVRKGDQGGWTVRLSDAQLTFTGVKEADPSAWNTGTMVPFDVIASAVIQLKVPRTGSATRAAATPCGTRTPKQASGTNGSRLPSWRRRCAARCPRWTRSPSTLTTRPTERSALPWA